MRLYLVRHGQAKPKEEDPDRSLSAQGRAEVEKLAAFVKPLKLRVDAVWHSGKARAHQTAEILASAISAKHGVIHHDDLDPDDSVNAVRKELKGMEADIVIVGHLPYLANLASLLISGEENEDMFSFPTSTMMALDKTDEGWQLAWVLTPDILAGGK